MKLNSREIRGDVPRANAPGNRAQRRVNKFWKNVGNAARTVGKAAAVGVAAFVLAAPLISRDANADDGLQKGKNSGALEVTPMYSDEKTEGLLRAAAKNPKNSKEEREKAQEAADELAAKRKAKKTGDSEDAEKTPTFEGDHFDYSEAEIKEGVGAAGGVEEDIPKEKPAEEPAKEAAKEAPAEEEEDDGNKVVRHNVVFPPAPSSYDDPLLGPFQDANEMGGERRTIKLDSPIDLGINFLANEAGEAVFGAFRYRNLVRMDLGALSFRGPLAPFARVMLRPEITIWRLKGAYYGSAAFMGNMASWVYSSHSVGLGYSQPMGENFRLRMGGIIGGALSYPAYDDTYVNFSVGISAEIAKTLLLYGVPTFYFSATDPIKTAYIGHYEPKIQDVETGAQVMLGQYSIRGFANIGLMDNLNYGIYNRYGFRGTRTVSVRGKARDADLDIWFSLGMTHWSPQLGGRIDPLVMVGINAIIGGKNFNSTNTAEYSHMQDGSIEFAETDIPDRDHPGPYGFGRSGDPHYDVPINEMKERMVNASSFEEFKNSYGHLSEDEVILRTRFLGAFMQQVAYANNAYASMTNGNIFDPEIKRIADSSNEDIFQYLQQYVDWYQNNSGPMPENLKNGIAVCAGIHWLMAEFMRANGVDAIVMSVNTPNGMHVITAGQLNDKTVLLDYGNTYETPAGTLDQALRFYGWNNGAPTFQSQFFGKDGYMGTYVTSEGRLLHRTVGLDNPDLLKKDFLGVR
ncbi:MAG: hypothetical protein GY852_10835 [bacterium]|nr:hypothetical protein [bacterium]